MAYYFYSNILVTQTSKNGRTTRRDVRKSVDQIQITIHTEQFSSLKHCLCTKTFVTHSKIVEPLYRVASHREELIHCITPREGRVRH
jgi:hypothetical protein